MVIESMTTEEKSAMLARLAGWKSGLVAECGFLSGLYRVYTADDLVVFHEFIANSRKEGDVFPDLYLPENMVLAWRVLNWAMTRQDWLPAPNGDMGWLSDHMVWLFDEDLLSKPPAEAQATWLDKVVSLAIEAGILDKANG